MQLDRKYALKLWESAFGKVVEATDFTGRKINKSSYLQTNSKVGWVVSYVVPRSEGGHDEQANLICIHTATAAEKGDNFPFFNAKDRKYVIAKDEETSEWRIELALDSESLAEQEAKTAAAIEKWNAFFGEEYEKAIDFCGRKIHREEYNTDSEFAWKVAKYVEDKPSEYIAHVASIDEAEGRTAFTANGKFYSLHRENGAYFFKLNEPKPKPEPERVAESAPEPIIIREPAVKPRALKGVTLRLKRPEPVIIREPAVKPRALKGVTLRLKRPEPVIIREPAVKPRALKGVTLRLKRPEPVIIREPAVKPKALKGVTLRLKRPEPETAAPTFDVRSPYDVAQRIGEIMTASRENSGKMIDFLIAHIVTRPNCPADIANGIYKTVSMIVKESAGEWLDAELSEMQDEYGAVHMIVTYRFDTPTPADFEKILASAKVLNSYSMLLVKTVGVEQLKIFNYASFISASHVDLPVSGLCARYPEFKAVVDAVYDGTYGRYAEMPTTLFLSSLIAYNVAELKEMCEDGGIQFLPPVGMVEYNAYDPDVSGILFSMLGAPRHSEEPAPSAETSAPATAETATSVDETVPAAEAASEAPSAETSAPATAETATSVDETVPVAEAASEAPSAEMSAPATVETATSVDETVSAAEAASEAPSDETSAPATVETATSVDETSSITETVSEAPETTEVLPEADSEEVAEEQATTDNSSVSLASRLAITLASARTNVASTEVSAESEADADTAPQNLASELTSTLAVSLAHTDESSPADEAPEAVEGVSNAPVTAEMEESEEEESPFPTKTPEGEQLTMAFPPHDARDDDGVLTLDLDSFD